MTYFIQDFNSKPAEFRRRRNKTRDRVVGRTTAGKVTRAAGVAGAVAGGIGLRQWLASRGKSMPTPKLKAKGGGLVKPQPDLVNVYPKPINRKGKAAQKLLPGRSNPQIGGGGGRGISPSPSPRGLPPSRVRALPSGGMSFGNLSKQRRRVR
ncbi:MAG TPA: hypothetical protein V6C65_04295 [Allocoleopsis sp.]